MARLVVVGSSDAFNSMGRSHSCYWLEGQGFGPLMIDFGATSLMALRRVGREPRELEGDVPLLVTAESGPWRRVRDPGGAEVWIHSVHLEDRRTVYVLGGRLGSAALRRAPRAKARVVAYLERGVVARLEACRGEWRKLAVEDREGWVEVAALWGAESCAPAVGNS